MAGYELALRELNALTKAKLIEIILTKKLPSDVKLSESTRNLVEFEFMDTNSENGELKKIDQPDIAYKLLCVESDLKCANLEIDCQKRLITEMERSISNQQLTITSQECLLKLIKESANDEIKKYHVAESSFKLHGLKKNTEKPVTSDNKHQRVRETTETSGNLISDIELMEPASKLDNKSKKCKQIPSHNKQLSDEVKEVNSMSAGKNEWKTVSRKSNSRKGTICTGLSAPKHEKSPIIGVQRKRWLYLGKIAGDTSEDAILEYLCHISGHEEIVVKKLNTLGLNSAFSIGAPNDEIYNVLNDKDFWPTGTLLRPFNFQNFFRKGGKSMENM